MKGYKAFNKDMTCRGFQYEEGKIYEMEEKPDICNQGFHFCENPLDILNYYDLCNSEFTEVEALGKTSKKENDDTKISTNKLKIGVKLNIFGFVKASIEYITNKCNNKEKEDGDNAQSAMSGDDAKSAMSGYNAKSAMSGNYAKSAMSGDIAKSAMSGNYAQSAMSGDIAQSAMSGDDAKSAMSGDNAKSAMSGYNAKSVMSGNYAKITLEGENNVSANIGISGQIKGVVGSWITLAEYNFNNECICVKSAQIDGEILKANTWYKLRNKEFTECEV